MAGEQHVAESFVDKPRMRTEQETSNQMTIIVSV